MINEVKYLGDGLYAKFDGYSVDLMANSHERPTDIVSLEPEVLTAFLSYVGKLKVYIDERNKIRESFTVKYDGVYGESHE